jgi:hypothetical protein
MAQVVECLPSKHEALSSNSTTTKKKEKKQWKNKLYGIEWPAFNSKCKYHSEIYYRRN